MLYSRAGTIIAVILIGAIFAVVAFIRIPTVSNQADQNLNRVASSNTNSFTIIRNTSTAAQNSNTTISPRPTAEVALPMTGFFERVTKKKFRTYVTPASSPVQPEKFTGFHTGADAETTAAESNAALPVYAIAAGTVVAAQTVNGYGGVIIIRHTVKQETVTALYGHVRLSSVKLKVGDAVTAGQQIALLGTGFSTETDGERKHLHLSILKGTVVNYRGYVLDQGELSAWVDPVAWLQQHGL